MFNRKPYTGSVFFDSKGWHRTDARRKRKLVAINGEFFLARRGDLPHQTRYHVRYAEVTPI